MTTTLTKDTPVADPFEREAQHRNLVGLLATVTFLLGVSAATETLSTVSVIIAFIAMIMLHELGHFVTAKAAGMKVTEYFLGFGPRLWSIRRGETEYGVKALPLGGYVRIIGMHNLDPVDSSDESRTYRSKPYWRRMSVALAGSTMHFLIAIALLFSLFAWVGVPDNDRVVISEISRLREGPSPAQEAGFQVGDEIVSIDGHSIKDFTLADYVRPRPNQSIEFLIRRDDRTITLTAVPTDLSKIQVVTQPGEPPIARPTRPTGFLGIGGSHPDRTYGILPALGHSAHGLVSIAGDSMHALVSFFSPGHLSEYGRLLTDSDRARPDDEVNRFLSPLGFARVAGQAADSGLRDVLTLLILVNIFVGLFNLVPLLPLDGGHVAIATYERIRSRRGRPYRADVAKLLPLTYGVVLVLVTLAGTSLFLDISQPLANPFE
jgi:membrane-associated protease RseP (regulator of RpoE activity)